MHPRDFFVDPDLFGETGATLRSDLRSDVPIAAVAAAWLQHRAALRFQDLFGGRSLATVAGALPESRANLGRKLNGTAEAGVDDLLAWAMLAGDEVLAELPATAYESIPPGLLTQTDGWRAGEWRLPVFGAVDPLALDWIGPANEITDKVAHEVRRGRAALLDTWVLRHWMAVALATHGVAVDDIRYDEPSTRFGAVALSVGVAPAMVVEPIILNDARRPLDEERAALRGAVQACMRVGAVDTDRRLAVVVHGERSIRDLVGVDPQWPVHVGTATLERLNVDQEQPELLEVAVSPEVQLEAEGVRVAVWSVGKLLSI
jgi:hypothetical protein